MGRFALIAAAFLLASGCPRLARKRKVISAPSKTSLPSELILSHLQEKLRFPEGYAFRIKCQVSYEGEQKQNFQLRIIGTDSLLWMSGGLMGFEWIRMLWRNDSLFILNRLLREAYIGPVDSLHTFFPAVRPADFLALLLGYWPPTFKQTQWEWFPQESRLRGTHASYTAEAHISPNWTIIGWNLERKTESFRLEYDYTNATAKQPYPTARLVLPDETQLSLIPKEVEFSPADMAMPFSIPEGYLIKSLSSFGL
ncbi:MAG: DUF4292 domain-containing protein [Bacteroidia bacterium]|nr:DUF4292 domain-containing protein [Bacteroidia bacterium]MDW8015441.1 DUF4292 domain-containing protein [Bacteroidia bacterium]